MYSMSINRLILVLLMITYNFFPYCEKRKITNCNFSLISIKTMIICYKITYYLFESITLHLYILIRNTWKKT